MLFDRQGTPEPSALRHIANAGARDIGWRAPDQRLTMKTDGTGERILTEGFHNEGPTWSPNGLFIMFFREAGGGGGPKIYMVDVFGRSEIIVPTPGYASDPAWGPLQG